MLLGNPSAHGGNVGKKRLNIALRKNPAMHVTRVIVGHNKLVYVLRADKSIKYRWGKSKVAYIGTTKNGVNRVAQSAAAWTDQLLSRHGIKTFDVRILFCRPRQNVKTWKKLEDALLLAFRERYGEVPTLNTQGKKKQESDEFTYFARARVKRILDELA